MPDEASMHADRHHARTLSALLVQHIEGVADELIPLRCRSGLPDELSIIVGERVRHDEMRLAIDILPERQLVRVGVRVVEEPALIDEQPARVDAWPVPGIPAFRSVPDGPCQRFDSLPDLFELLSFPELMRSLPTPSVTAHVKSRIANRSRRLRVAFDGQRACKDGHRQLA